MADSILTIPNLYVDAADFHAGEFSFHVVLGSSAPGEKPQPAMQLTMSPSFAMTLVAQMVDALNAYNEGNEEEDEDDNEDDSGIGLFDDDVELHFTSLVDQDRDQQPKVERVDHNPFVGLGLSSR